MPDESVPQILDIVERVARVLCEQSVLRISPAATAESIAFHFDAAAENWRANARAAIAAMREPTDAMITAGAHSNSEWHDDEAPLHEHAYRDSAKAIWQAMNDMALKE
jgi:hypothetical protein